ncbi:MAG: FAD-dependent oxidoreductase, partial [Nocardioides sp.]|nr:FAD-dependent oxidoreductase [Nocardioides sp.]
MESPRLPVTIVGAGISGVACARVLAAAGIPVELVDRGRRVGGRMASRRHEGRPADIGASYVTVSDPAFEDVVARWAEAGLAQEWTDTFGVASGVDEGRTTTAG